jgi:hypothetical protein
LFVVVYAEDRFLRPQGSLASAGPAVTAAPADGPGKGIGWLAILMPGCSGVPAARPGMIRARDRLAAPGWSRRERQSSPVYSHMGTVPPSGMLNRTAG